MIIYFFTDIEIEPTPKVTPFHTTDEYDDKYQDALPSLTEDHQTLDDFLDIKMVKLITICSVLFLNFIEQLAELKNVFDRFSCDDFMTTPETCQALTECGLCVPRR